METLPIEGADYFIIYMNLPPKIYAFIRANSDGTATIVLDPRRSWEQQFESFWHEYWHLIRDDIYNGQPIQLIESRERVMPQ